MAFTAEIDNTGDIVVIPEEGTLLAAALDAGIAYPHGCRKGRCGRCKSHLLRGEVSLLPHTHFALSEEERAAGLILACRTQPLTDIAVRWIGRPAAASLQSTANEVTR
jgi:ferredoxin